jgi:flagellar motor switch protein FliN/FliY
MVAMTEAQPLPPSTSSAPAAPASDLDKASIDMLMEVPLLVTVELGRSQMTLRHALDLQPGSVVELDRLAGDPVDIYVNERRIARGEVVVVDDKFAVRITELVPSKGSSNGHGE